jgi:methylmalonyl-CoA mutase C-terminal domain/subunit
MRRKIRVLVGKPGLDGHDRGAKVVAAALRDAGMEVIYTGLHQTPEQIVEAAVQEDVDVVALSILSGAHMTLFPATFELMREQGIGDRLLTGGGIIPPEDMESLARLGVGRLFGPGASTQDIAAYIREWFRDTHGDAELATAPSMARESLGTADAPETATRMPALARSVARARAPRPAKRVTAKPKRAAKKGAQAKRTVRRAKTRVTRARARVRASVRRTVRRKAASKRR